MIMLQKSKTSYEQKGFLNKGYRVEWVSIKLEGTLSYTDSHYTYFEKFPVKCDHSSLSTHNYEPSLKLSLMTFHSLK